MRRMGMYRAPDIETCAIADVFYDGKCLAWWPRFTRRFAPSALLQRKDAIRTEGGADSLAEILLAGRAFVLSVARPGTADRPRRWGFKRLRAAGRARVVEGGRRHSR